MTQDEIRQQMAACDARCEAAIGALAAGYTARAALFAQVVRGAHDEGGQFRGFDAANDPKLSQHKFGENLLRRMRQLGLGGMIRHRVP